ncbi:PRC and DUF2382 domain-containing protein, partial [Streptomyces daliensis]|nr:PRC and DUF2382 domain-containing protein [Streptomyces daliensis]
MEPNGRTDGFTNSEELSGLTVYDPDGDKIGSVEHVYVDDRTGRPDWVTCKTGLFGSKETFVPLAGARRQGSDLHIPYSKEMVKGAPNMDADQHLDRSEEEQLYRHYGLDRRTGMGTSDERGMDAGTGTGTGAGAGAGAGGMAATGAGAGAGTGRGTGGSASDMREPAMARSTDKGDEWSDKESMIRSEEQMHVGTEEHEVGHARLHKYVVTEHVTKEVPVSHEEVRVVREPINEADRPRSASIEESEIEVTLHAEEPTVRKDTVAVERVRLDTEKVTEQQEVSADIRKEQVEYDTKDDDASGG